MPEHLSHPRAARLIDAARSDRAGGVTLIVGTVAALVWSNWPGSASYRHLWSTVAPWSHLLGVRLSLRDWVNQGLMTGFFALVGLEIRREITVGELRSWRRAPAPIAAAVGGMAIPAAIYALMTRGSPGGHGWGIPMATDVAFAVGALALVGGRRFPRLRPFLMTLAVADDIASIVILVCFYSQDVQIGPLIAGLVCLAAMAALRTMRITGWAQLALGLVCWWALLHGGVEAAVVGVALGMCVPLSHGHRDVDIARRWSHGPRYWEEKLAPWVNALILPVFALANTGVRFAGSDIASGPALRVFAAVVIARVIGKPVGIFVGARAVERTGLVPPTARIATPPLMAVGAAAGIGFTVPLLIIAAALPDGSLADGATAGLLFGSVLAALIARVLLAAAVRQRRRSASVTTGKDPTSGPVPADEAPLSPCRAGTKYWQLGLVAATAVAVIDAALGPRLILLAAVIVGPCWALLGARVAPVAGVSIWAVSLATVLGIPDGIWDTPAHYVFLAAVAVVCATTTACAFVVQRTARPDRGSAVFLTVPPSEAD